MRRSEHRSTPVVVGSGHAGYAAVRELIRLGERPIVVDAGTRLDGATQRVVDRLATSDVTGWTDDDRKVIERNSTLRDSVPKHLRFGSDYVYAGDDDRTPVRRQLDTAPTPSLALGGLSNVWSAAMLPTAAIDMARWPIERSDLMPHYRDLLGSMPLTGEEDGLEGDFPLLRRPAPPLPMAATASELLHRLERRGPEQPDKTHRLGVARLAVASETGDPLGCRGCGLCHVGCVYGSIWSTRAQFERWIAEDAIDYRGGLVVAAIEERDSEVVLHCADDRGRSQDIVGTSVFLAAGAINSTRIVLESLGAWEQPVTLASTQGFIAPLVHAWGAVPDEHRIGLAAFFLELQVPGTRHWVHTQVAPMNQIATAKAERYAGRLPGGHRLLAGALRHTLVAVCNFHSDDSGHHRLTLRRRSSGPSVIEVETVAREGFAPLARTGARELRRILRGTGVHVTLPIGGFGRPAPISWHVGGSLPMARRPSGPFSTDVLGRPAPWQRVHVVDSSVLPSIPATTIALPAMANAARIVSAAHRAGDSITERRG